MSTKRGKFDFLAEARQPLDTEQAPPEQHERAHVPMSTSAPPRVERRPSGQRIRADLLRAYKILAAETGTPQYLLIETAMEEYLAKKRTS